MATIESSGSNQTKYVATLSDSLKLSAQLDYTWAAQLLASATQQPDGNLIEWNDIDADRYQVWRSGPNNLDDFDLLTGLAGDQTSFKDTVVQEGYPYRYQVRADKGEAESIRSTVASTIKISHTLNLSGDFNRQWFVTRGWSDQFDLNDLGGLYQYVVYDEDLGDRIQLTDKLDTDYIVPAVELEGDHRVPEFSHHGNSGHAHDITVEANRYNSGVYTRSHLLAELLNNNGEFFTDYPDYDAHPLYSYVIDVSVDLTDFSDYPTGDLRDRVEGVMDELPLMHPAGKTAYIHVHATDKTGQQIKLINQVRQELVGQDYFDDGGRFDVEEEGYPDTEEVDGGSEEEIDHFDEGQDLIHRSLQEYYFVDYQEFDDTPREHFDECGQTEKYYSKHFEENWETDTFDDGGTNFDSGGPLTKSMKEDWEFYDYDGDYFDTDNFVENRSSPMPDKLVEPDDPDEYYKTRFDQQVRSIHMTIEQGRDV